MSKISPEHKSKNFSSYFIPLKNRLKSNIFASICIAICFFMLIGVSIGIYAKEDAQTRDNNIVIAIDPGHGGNDPGKVSENGVKEKDINLAIGLKLKSKLEERGYTVIITRDSDISLADRNLTNAGSKSWKRSDMTNRIQNINNAKPTCLISIHQNSFTAPSISGPQVFYHKESAEGMALAQCIQDSLIQTLSPPCKREIHSGDDYYILKNSNCIGVIVECGFLSNPEEVGLLSDDSYQNKLADAISGGIDSYLK